ncbi:MAG: VTT domain-containing protein [Candidatus Nanoarchaeia archaeon]
MDIISIISWFSSWSASLVETFGYFGVFVVAFIGAATIFLPLPAFLIIFAFGAILNPWIVGFIAALGSTIGELSGYGLGLLTKKAVEKKHEKWLKKAKEWMEKYKAFFVIIFFAATPLPDDVLGILFGTVKYDLKKFLIATFIGKLILNLALALGGYYGIRWVLTFFGGG